MMEVCLVVVSGDVSPDVCPLVPHQIVTLGRHRTNRIVLSDRHASRQHAEVYHADGRWYIRDCGTLNGTRVNEGKINQPTLLAEADEIHIGDTRLRFVPASAAATVPQTRSVPAAEPEPDLEQTGLQTDELSVLCSFMAACVGQTTTRAVVERAVAVVHGQTGASLAGFLSLDLEQPLPRVVVPQLASVDAQLSRRLTRLAQQRGRLVWLAREIEDPESDSLLHFRDAVCVPLLTNGHVFGALHMYRVGRVFGEREVHFCELLAGYLANSLQSLRSRRTLEAENSRLRDHAPAADEQIIGSSPPMLRLKQDIARLAPYDHTVLITGDSGVGKELVALALHRHSRRCDAPLVPVNCAAISPSLREAEWFGHREGAFSGAARDRAGFFEQADDGTLFLDEIGELSLECQALLLRVIEGKGFRPVGGMADAYADVRIVAATNRDLNRMVQEGKFREDLFYRLGMQLRVPPLRDRAEDIPDLVNHFLPRLSQEYHRQVYLTSEALARLQRYSWPGNVRQLWIVLQNAAALTDDAIDVTDLRLDESLSTNLAGLPRTLNLTELETWAIREALRQAGSNRSRAARLLDIGRDALYDKARRYGIDLDNP